MKITKLFAITLQSKIRIAFLIVALLYNFVLGFYLKDFLVLSQTLTVFYLLSILACLFLIVEIKTKAMIMAVYISLILIACMNIVYAIYCRRVFPFLALLSLAIVFLYLIAFANKIGKDNLLTKIYTLVVSAIIVALIFNAYVIVYKQENVSLANGQATLWHTKTVELADEICTDCDTDEEKVKSIYEWMIYNFEYDNDSEPFIQYFNIRKTIKTKKGICYDFAHLFAALCRSQSIPCFVIDGTKIDVANYHHTWNRVYFNGSWWNIDVTFDIVQTKTKGELYGFRTIDGAFVDNEGFFITKVY